MTATAATSVRLLTTREVARLLRVSERSIYRLVEAGRLRPLRAAAERAGVPWAGLHTLRRTAATILFRRGWNAVQVQKFLGHHSPTFTLATYVHLLPDDLPEPTFLDLVIEPGERLSEASNEAVIHG